MVKVVLSGTLKSKAGGQSEFEIEAQNIRQLLNALEADYPHLEDILEAGVAVSINGEIYRDNWFQPIPKDAEVFLLPRLQGG